MTRTTDEFPAAHVLLADDEDTFRMSVADILRADGYRVTEAVDAADALAVLANQAVDVVVSDIRMRGNEGLALVRDVLQRDERPPVVLVTGFPSIETAIPAVNLSVHAYLTKPVAPETLLDHVRSAVLRHRTAAAVRDMQRHAQAWREQLAALDAHARSSATGGDTSLAGFASVTLGTIARSLEDLRRVISVATTTDAPTASACVQLNCPRHAQLTLAIRDAIDVLEATKGTFKSRQLGELRTRLERSLGPELNER